MRSCGTRPTSSRPCSARILREAGFGWVVVRVQDGTVEDPVQADWVYRFRLASGLPVGGWGVLRTEPEAGARLGSELVTR